MKITKPGNLAKSKGYYKFKCPDCDCEFIANNKEYTYSCGIFTMDCPCCDHNINIYSTENIIKKYNEVPLELLTPKTRLKLKWKFEK